MHLADCFDLPDGYTARPYRGLDDLPAMLDVLVQHREHIGDPERPTLDQMRATYTHLTESDPVRDIALIDGDCGARAVAYARASWEPLTTGVTDGVVFAPIVPADLHQPLFDAVVTGLERHLMACSDPTERIRLRAYAGHPGPDRAATGEAAWLEQLGYVATEWGASLRRPHLDHVPDLPLPDGVEVRPVRADQVRQVWEAHYEAFRGEWDFREWAPADIDREVDDPTMDHTLWQVAWTGDQVVGQVKPFINAEENEARGYRRGYTEYISTHHEWRNRGIASALLARGLMALRERGMTEAAMGVDTNNPGGALHVYTRLGFQLEGYQVVYTKPATAT